MIGLPGYGRTGLCMVGLVSAECQSLGFEAFGVTGIGNGVTGLGAIPGIREVVGIPGLGAIPGIREVVGTTTGLGAIPGIKEVVGIPGLVATGTGMPGLVITGVVITGRGATVAVGTGLAPYGLRATGAPGIGSLVASFDCQFIPLAAIWLR